MSNNSILNDYFDQIYVINLRSREDRMSLMDKRLRFFDINYERVDAISGPALKGVFKYLPSSSKYTSPNYMAANLTHLSIYSEALRQGHTNILILEDDLRIHRQVDNIFRTLLNEDLNIRHNNFDLLYLAFIPVTEDLSRWDYTLINNKFLSESKNLIKANNLWSLMSYGITIKMMKHVLEIYSKSFIKELDRFFVEDIQTNKKFLTFGIVPQLFAGDNVLSDNDGINHVDMLTRSVDRRYANLEDYI